MRTGDISVDSPASRIGSRRGARNGLHRSFACVNARAGLHAPQRTSSRGEIAREKMRRDTQRSRESVGRSSDDAIRPLADFHADPRYAAICIAPTWLGLYTQRAAASQNNKSETKYLMPAIFRKKAIQRGNETTRNELRSRRSAPSSRSAERARGHLLSPSESTLMTRTCHRKDGFARLFLVRLRADQC